MKKLILIAIVALSFNSCKVTLVPTKSQPALDLLSQIRTDANAAFSSLTYDSGKYLIVDTEIFNLITLDKSRSHSGTIVKQDLRMQTAFDKYESEHSNKGTISQGESNVYQTYFGSFIDPRINSENSLK